MTLCPCCNNTLIKEFRHQEFIWFCRSCWQEMPDLASLLNQKNSSFNSTNIVLIQSKRSRNKGEMIPLPNPQVA